MRRITTVLFIILIFAAGVVSAREILQADTCIITEDETIQGNLFVFCRSLEIAGEVEGSIIGASTNVIIHPTGVVDGSLYLLAAQMDIAGEVGENIHFAGGVLNIQDSARLIADTGDLLSLSLSTQLQPQARIPRNIVALGYQLLIDGEVGNEVNFWGSALAINGHINGDVYANVGDPSSTGASQLETLLLPLSLEVDFIDPGIIITRNSYIGGQLAYTSVVAGEIDGVVVGAVKYTPTTVGTMSIDLEEPDLGRSLELYFSQVVREFTTLGFIGAVALFLMPNLLQRPILELERRPVSSVVAGLLSFIISFPIVLIVLLISILLIAILSLLRLEGVIVAGSILLMVVDIGGTSLFYFVAIFIGRVIVCLVIGRLIVRVVINDQQLIRKIPYINLGIGVLVLSLIGSLPVVGLIFNALALFLGLGAVLSVTVEQINVWRQVSPPTNGTTTAAAAATSSPAYHQPAPPPLSQPLPPGPGMENLPEGFSFRWWDDDEGD